MPRAGSGPRGFRSSPTGPPVGPASGATTESSHVAHERHRRPVPQAVRRISTETKASVKTTELIAYVVVSVAVLIASAVVDAEDFGAQDAFFLVTLLTIGYMVSRGLAKSGSRDYYDDEASLDARDSRSSH